MAQQKQYLSTDPNAGRYVSTDPNAGQPQPLSEKRDATLSAISDWWAKNISTPVESFIQRIQPPDRSVMEAPTVDRTMQRMMTPVVSGLANVVAHPVENLGTIGALLAQATPIGRTTAVARGVMPTAFRAAATNAAKSAVGGGVGGTVSGLMRGDANPLRRGVAEAALQGGADLALGTGQALVGGGLRGLGRTLAYRALDPTTEDLAALHMLNKGTPEGFRRLPLPFVPSASRRSLKDTLEQEAITRPNLGSIGGEKAALDAILAADASDAMQENIIRKTLQRTGPRMAPDVGVGTGAAHEPLPQYAIDLSGVTANVQALANKAGSIRGGVTPHETRAAIESVADRFLQRDPESRRFYAPANRLLPEPNVPVLLSRSNESLPLDPSGSLSQTFLPVAKTADELAHTGRDPWRTQYSEALPTRKEQEAYYAPKIGQTQSELLPTSAMRPDLLKYNLGEASGAGVSAAAPRGTVLLPQSRANRLVFLQQNLDRLPESALGTVDEMLAALEKQGVTMPQPKPSLVAGMDAAVDVLREIDDDLMSTMQERVGQLGKVEKYVPTPSERAKMAIRSELRNAINAVAPQGQSLSGEALSLSDVLAQQQRDIIMRDMKVRATGDDMGNIRARAGWVPPSASNPVGRPLMSVGENFARFGGSFAPSMMRGGRKALGSIPQTSAVARLAALLALNQPTITRTAEDVNLSGIGR